MFSQVRAQEDRIRNLLSKMSVEEKVAQLRSTFMAWPAVNDALLNNPHVMDSLYGNGIGMINPGYGADVEKTIDHKK